MPETDRRDGPAARAVEVRHRWLPLVPLTVVVALLAAVDVLPVWPGLVHLVALPPLDFFGDLRVLLTETSGVPSFVLLLVVVFAVRTVVLALMMGGLTRERLAWAAAFYGVLGLPLLLAAELVYMANTLLYARLFWFGLIAVVVLAFLCAPVPWASASREAEAGPRFRDALVGTWRDGPRVWVLLGYAVAVSGIGVLAHQFPALTIPLLPVSAVATAGAITALTWSPPPRPLLRLGSVGLVLTLVATVWITTRGTGPSEAGAPREGSLLLMSGVNSRSGSGDMFGTDPALLGYECEQTYYFSYAGTGDGQPRGQALCPLRTGTPYTEEDTQRPFEEQVATFAEQVRGLPRPLVVAGHSQGAWVAWKAVATGAAPEVDALVLVGAFPESTGGYRDLGEPGPGRPASDLMHLLLPFAAVFDFDLEPGAPAPKELLGSTERPDEIFARPLPEHTRALSTPSSTDLPLMPSGWRMDVDRNICPIRTPHAYLPTRPAYYEEVNRFLDDEPPRECPVAFDWGGPLTVPFSTPTVLVDHTG